MIDLLKWDLSELFASHEECYAAFETIENLIVNLQRWKTIDITKENLKELLDEYFACKDLAYRCLVYGSLRYYADVTDEEMSKFKVEVEKLNSDTESALSFIEEMIITKGEKNIREMLTFDPQLETYEFFLSEAFRKTKHTCSTEEKRVLLKEISELNRKYNKILSKVEFAPIEVDGKEIELTSSNVAKYLAARNRETRKATFTSLNEGYKVHAEEVANILNEIMRRRIKVAQIEKYDSVKEQSLDKENIYSHLLDELFTVVHKNLKHLQNYMTIKAKHMNLDDAHLYDLGVPLDEGIKRKFPIEEGFTIAKDAFELLGENYTRIVDDLIERGHIDAISNDKKHQSITFSWLGYSFLNYRESYNDLKNLVHELGHSINDSLSQNLPFPYRISTVFAGETASITNEILLNRSLLDHAKTDEEKVFYLSKEIDNYVTSIYRQTMYTELEDILYEKVANGITLTPDILNESYMKILKTYYGDEIIYDELSAYEWMRVGRMFRWTYYSYTYATGLLIANSVYTKLKNGSIPIETYIEFLSSGCKEDPLKLLQALGIDFKDTSIMDIGFEVMANDIADLNRLLHNCQK